MSHNPPERPGPKAPGRAFINARCVKCGLCLESCPAQAIRVVGTDFLTGENCTACAACVEVCPVGAAIIIMDPAGL